MRPDFPEPLPLPPPSNDDAEALAARVQELERLVMAMAEKIWLMSSHLTKLSIKVDRR